MCPRTNATQSLALFFLLSDVLSSAGSGAVVAPYGRVGHPQPSTEGRQLFGVWLWSGILLYTVCLCSCLALWFLLAKLNTKPSPRNNSSRPECQPCCNHRLNHILTCFFITEYGRKNLLKHYGVGSQPTRVGPYPHPCGVFFIHTHTHTHTHFYIYFAKQLSQ